MIPRASAEEEYARAVGRSGWRTFLPPQARMVGRKAATTFLNSARELDQPPPPDESSTFAKPFLEVRRVEVLTPEDKSCFETWVG